MSNITETTSNTTNAVCTTSSFLWIYIIINKINRPERVPINDRNVHSTVPTNKHNNHTLTHNKLSITHSLLLNHISFEQQQKNWHVWIVKSDWLSIFKFLSLSVFLFYSFALSRLLCATAFHSLFSSQLVSVAGSIFYEHWTSLDAALFFHFFHLPLSFTVALSFSIILLFYQNLLT